MARRTDLQQLVIPENLQKLLNDISAIEERSMSGSVRMMIARRAKELGLIGQESTEDTDSKDVVHA